MAANNITIEQYNQQKEIEQFEAKVIVRKFSIEVAEKEPDGFMAQSLVQYTELEEVEETGEEIAVVQARAWSALYESSALGEEVGNDDDVANESQLLQKVWQEFILELDHDDTKKKNKNKGWLENLPTRGELTIDSLKTVVLEAETRWKNKGRGNIQKYFHKFSANVNSHAVLLDILPGQSQYGSIFVGSLKTLIQASANHEKVAEILSESLSKITAKLSICVTQLKLYGIGGIKNGVGKIYARIFHFIRTAMDWYRSSSIKRALKSMSIEFPMELESQVAEIMEIADEVHELARTAHGAETRDARITGECTAENVASLKEIAERTERKVDELWSHAAKLEVGHNMANFLLRDIYAIVHDAKAEGVKAGIAAASNRKLVEDASTRQLLPPSVSTRPAMESLQSACNSLRGHILYQAEPHDLLAPNGLYLENSTISALQTWSESAASRTLWISTGRSSSHPAISSKVAASVANAASRARIPLVWFHYWPLASDGSFEGFELGQRALISLLYTLIKQVINLYHGSLGISNLSVERLQKLDGTLETWDEGLSILAEALALAPPLLLVIMDGLENIDDSECGEEYLEDLLVLLRRESRNNEKDGNGKALKLLFTTTRDCTTLNTILDDEDNEYTEILRCQTRRSKKSAGKMRAGRSKLKPFGDAESGSSDEEDDGGASHSGD